jgi:hypothetical protein
VKKDTRLLSRREFNGLCVTLSSLVTSSGASAVAAATGVASTAAYRTVKFRDGTIVPAVGQGSGGLGKGRHLQHEEGAALRAGLELGMTLIDTAEVYGSEEFIGRVAGLDHSQRQRVCNSGIRFGGACQGERGGVLLDTDTAGASRSGCSASTARALVSIAAFAEIPLSFLTSRQTLIGAQQRSLHFFACPERCSSIHQSTRRRSGNSASGGDGLFHARER